MEIEQLQDKIYDVYYSQTNKIFRDRVRERIHWICENASGSNILDVGCSQGITPILLGREGKRVLGIDLSESAINNANENLEKESTATQSLVHFQKENFMLYHFEEQYDSVILGEVLEHINDIQAFFTKAASLVNDNGKLIVTTPFGINDFDDHKRTFYLLDFIKLQSDNLPIVDIKFFGKWIGVVYKKTSAIAAVELNDSLIEQFEQSIYGIERGLLDKQNHLQEELSRIKKQLNEEKAINKSLNDNKNYKRELLNEKTEKVKIQKELIEQYNKEERLMNELKELGGKYEILQGRYNSIKNSKLGKLTLRYWSWRNRRGRK